MKKIRRIFLYSVPVLLMVALIPVVTNDYLLSVLYLAIIGAAYAVRHERNDLLLFTVGLVAMTISEFLFISTGVETFTRQSLFGAMPLWLPLLWGYGFVAIKRSAALL